MAARRIYQGYTITDVSTRNDDGQYRARVAIMSLDGQRTRSQRFLDLENFATEIEARERTYSAAIAWINQELKPVQLSLPTDFNPFD